MLMFVLVCLCLNFYVGSAAEDETFGVARTKFWNSSDFPHLVEDYHHREHKLRSPFDTMDVKSKQSCITTSYSTNFTEKYAYMNNIIEKCNDAGEICDQSLCGSPGPFFRYIQKDYSCEKMWRALEFDQPSTNAHPPSWHQIPQGIKDIFLYGQPEGTNMRVHGPKNVYNNKYYGTVALENIWDSHLIKSNIDKAKKGILKGQYGQYHASQLHEIIRKFQPSGSKNTALVVGSEQPWVESILLSVGFKNVTTVEYGKIKCTDKRITTYTPDEFRQRVLAGKYEGDNGFDAVVIYSSVEHSGLGRYGDAINPYGDIIMMARVHCVTRTGGRLYFTAPMTGDFDRLYFNAHRIYGPVSLPNLLANWKQIAGPKKFLVSTFKMTQQPVLVLEK